MTYRRLTQKGSALVTIIVVLPTLIFITALYMQLTVSSFKVARTDQFRSHAQFATDAGIDTALQEINQDDTWAGDVVEVELHNDGQVRTTYQTSVVDDGSERKIITAVGRSYVPAGNTTPSATITIQTDLRPIISGEYSVVGGVGGLIMTNSAKILGGDVFINGKVSLSNSAQIGLSTNPVNLSVAHQSCPNPPNATYPRLCNPAENGQPISLLNTSRIYGNVRANNQTSGASMFSPGLTASSGVITQALPPHDRTAQTAAVVLPHMTGSAASCSSGTKTWPANLKINGDVNITNSCKVTVNGDVWITGKLEMKNSAQMIVSNSLGATRPVIMVDGDIADFDNSSIIKSNTSNTGFQIITYKSNASCSPDCADVTGADLFNSQGETTIQLDNSASGPNTIFYSKWTKVLVKNSGQIGALIGQTVEINNSGTITFGTSAGTGTSFWVIDSYRRQFN